jgi:hypothetical protein
MAGGRNTSGLVNAEPDVAILADTGLAGVQAHPHSHLDPIGPWVSGDVPLGIDCRRNCILAALKSDEERVALRVDFSTVVRGKGSSQDALVVCEHIPVACA